MQVTDWHESGLTVGQVAERMNIAPSAVRWYDDHGLLPRLAAHLRDVASRRIDDLFAILIELTPAPDPHPAR